MFIVFVPLSVHIVTNESLINSKVNHLPTLKPIKHIGVIVKPHIFINQMALYG